jgi:hypothetical protein
VNVTLDEAVKILNDRRHRDCDTWSISSQEGHPNATLIYGNVWPEDLVERRDTLEPFEVIATAEKYLNESS